MNDITQNFYDDLSCDYHHLFWDWEESIKGQAKILNNLIYKYKRIPWFALLDCSCWIWTQSIWLAQKWYKVTASDLSTKSLERAEIEAHGRNLDINFQLADFMKLSTQIKGTFDVVISCDNSISHMLNNKDLIIAAQNIYSKVDKWWLFLGSIRDYDALLQEKPTATPLNIRKEWIISFQTWDWEKNNVYTMNHFTFKKDEGYKTHHRCTKLRAYQRYQIKTIFYKIWFTDIQWLMPEESGYFQPIILAYK